MFQQIFLSPLAQACYVIGDRGVAAVVDPRRDVDEVLAVLRAHDLTLEWVFLTHVHADFVAGHTELAEVTGARIGMSHAVDCGFPCEPLRDGDVVRIGEVSITVMETPGHTPGDLCYLVEETDPAANPRLLTGDTLFIGDVGRPDLAGGFGFDRAAMAGMMFDSVQRRLMPLADQIEVWPGHGAGSACGRNISTDASSTIGHQRQSNWAFSAGSRDEFVRELTAGLEPPPRYFGRAAELNRRGPRPTSQLPELRQVSIEELAAASERTQLVDVRSGAAYGAGHVAAAMNLGLGGAFETWSGNLLDADRPVLLLAEDQAMAIEARTRLLRVGIEDLAGWVPVRDALAAAAPPTTTLPQVTVEQLRDRLDEMQVVDVRKPGEFATRHVPGACPAPLAELAVGETPALEGLDRQRATAVICASGYRSSAAAQLLARRGFTDLHNVVGGTNAWAAAGHTVEQG
ncbi:MAG: MBL fold metallo-hydrolase [Planctomycetota bacterium]